jgi:hypothetical protein
VQFRIIRAVLLYPAQCYHLVLVIDESLLKPRILSAHIVSYAALVEDRSAHCQDRAASCPARPTHIAKGSRRAMCWRRDFRSARAPQARRLRFSPEILCLLSRSRAAQRAPRAWAEGDRLVAQRRVRIGVGRRRRDGGGFGKRRRRRANGGRAGGRAAPRSARASPFLRTHRVQLGLLRAASTARSHPGLENTIVPRLVGRSNHSLRSRISTFSKL